MSKSLLIKSVSILGQSPVDILIENGAIVNISTEISSSADEVLDATGLVALY